MSIGGLGLWLGFARLQALRELEREIDGAGKRGVDAERDGGETEEEEVGRIRTSGCALYGSLL
ncbi:hypothetical protein Dsin_028532 [Dipteronia sinensis]|uniref:Uncharacterized protein n=1 Tax=Dipteronia sinensis TaxID=43782 RepID=A0AAD9ZS81_9ROSI|nr:hypothetical protein Dsin_028532 [Dipteronia sinensis]